MCLKADACIQMSRQSVIELIVLRTKSTKYLALEDDLQRNITFFAMNQQKIMPSIVYWIMELNMMSRVLLAREISSTFARVVDRSSTHS